MKHDLTFFGYGRFCFFLTLECLNDCAMPWIIEVLQEVVKWPFSSHIVLNHKTQECQHCQSPCTWISQHKPISWQILTKGRCVRSFLFSFMFSFSRYTKNLFVKQFPKAVLEEFLKATNYSQYTQKLFSVLSKTNGNQQYENDQCFQFFCLFCFRKHESHNICCSCLGKF